MKTPYQNIGIIGSGNMGGQLGRLFSKAGYNVMFSSRHPEKLKSLISDLPNANVGNVEQTIEFADIVLLAINYATLSEVTDQLKDKNKVIIDLTNPFYWAENKTLAKVNLSGKSAGEHLQSKLPNSKIIKAFSSHYSASLQKGHRDYPIAVFYTTDEEDLKELAETVIADIGFAPVYYGRLNRSKDIELYGKFSNKIMTKEEALLQLA
ncbi:NAD(P)-binding domain-containing protein [Winogradskyella sp.]|uniref:NADPH-dependent F420 reductase n=1 Tax=Winogradskyella sp. TaxID=1883156 RepID=UPI00261BE615|nr:NAD(P)-binding domain-containing protein [Winogradskyella sp.]